MAERKVSADLEEFYVLVLNCNYKKVIERLESDQRMEAKELVLRAALGLNEFDQVYERMEKTLALNLVAARITRNTFPSKAREILEENMDETDEEIRELYISTLVKLEDYEFCYDWLNKFPHVDSELLRRLVDRAKYGERVKFELSDSDSEDSKTATGNDENGLEKGTLGKRDNITKPDSLSALDKSKVERESSRIQPYRNTLAAVNLRNAKIIINYARQHLPAAFLIISLLFYLRNRGNQKRAGSLIKWFEEKLYKTIQMGSSI